MEEDNLTLISNLAYLHLIDNELDEAKMWIEKARKLAPEDSQLKAMMDEYTARTGESFGDIIEEEYVRTPDKKEEETDEDDGYEEELKAMAEDDDDTCHHDGCGCGHHHEEGHHCNCGHHHEDEE